MKSISIMAYTKAQPKQSFFKRISSSLKSASLFTKNLLMLAKKVCMI